jgi:hypothetical protein
VRLDEYVEACNLEAVVQEVGGTEAETEAETLFNGQLVIVGNMENLVQHDPPEDRRLAGSGRLSIV